MVRRGFMRRDVQRREACGVQIAQWQPGMGSCMGESLRECQQGPTPSCAATRKMSDPTHPGVPTLPTPLAATPHRRRLRPAAGILPGGFSGPPVNVRTII